MANPVYDAKIEYLQSSGTQYIDTGIIPQSNPKLDFCIAFASTVDAHHVGNDKTKVGTIIFGRDTTRFYYRYYSTSLYYINETPQVNKFYHVILDNKLTIDGVVRHTNNTTFSSNSNNSIKIFASDTSKGTSKIKYFKIYDGGELVRDFIPVKKNNMGYMYDKVSGQLFGNAGTGSFTLGSELSLTTSGGYAEGVDRVSIDESFPYPIKLEYDENENILITPLWIPKHSNILVSKNKDGSLIDLQEDYIQGNLYIALEVSLARRKMYKNHKYNSSIDQTLRHPCRGGRFRSRYNNAHHFTLNTQLALDPYDYLDDKRIIKTASRNGHESSPWYDVRATYRYGSSQDLKRTGIYSNELRITFK